MSDETKNKPALEDNFAELEDILKQMEQPEISLEMGEIEGAMSSLSIAVAGILTVALSSLFAGFM